MKVDGDFFFFFFEPNQEFGSAEELDVVLGTMLKFLFAFISPAQFVECDSAEQLGQAEEGGPLKMVVIQAEFQVWHSCLQHISLNLQNGRLFYQVISVFEISDT